MDQVKFIIDGGGPAPPGPGRGPGARPQGHPGNAHANRGPQRQRGPGGPETAGRPDLAEASTARSSPLRRDVLPHRVPGDARAAGRDPAGRPAGSVPADREAAAALPARSRVTAFVIHIFILYSIAIHVLFEVMRVYH